jgi:hypothetical protein
MEREGSTKKSPGNHEVMEKEDGSMAVTTLQQRLERKTKEQVFLIVVERE